MRLMLGRPNAHARMPFSRRSNDGSTPPGVLSRIGALQVFAGPFIMTQGGPAYASLFYMLYLYQNAFSFFRMGYASALAWVLFIYIVALTALTFRGSALWVFYAGEVKRK